MSSDILARVNAFANKADELSDKGHLRSETGASMFCKGTAQHARISWAALTLSTCATAVMRAAVMQAPATLASIQAVPVTPAAASVRLGSSSSTAAASSLAVGTPGPHFTRSSVMSEGRTLSSSCFAQRTAKSCTSCSESTPLNLP